MPHYLLTGAGFSRNWGGWLADEAFEYLLTRPELDASLRNLLWEAKAKGGFETALAGLQIAYKQQPTAITKQQLDSLTTAIIAMFAAMNEAFASMRFEPTGDGFADDHEIARFLTSFDAIFTLNQDSLLEMKYVRPRLGQTPAGSYLPYLRWTNEKLEHFPFPYQYQMAPDLSLPLKDRVQPYYKLHGSSNWFSDKDERMLVMGGNKAELIKQFPILTKYHEEFARFLSAPDAKLMVIGYGFRDEHINQTIEAACKRGLKLFIIDYLGLDVIDTRSAANKNAIIPVSLTEFTETLRPNIIGPSRRDLRSTLVTDNVERNKLLSFFR